MSERYPSGTVAALLDSDHVSEPTRAALTARCDAAPGLPRWFSTAEMALLRTVCARLLPVEPAVEVAAAIDGRIADGTGNGWRFDALPVDGEAYRLGLRGISQSAQALFADEFAALSGGNQDAVLRAVQAGQPDGEAWAQVDAARFFKELLGEAAELYYAHPAAQEAIGYAGFADLPGWTAIGLNEREAREPVPVT